MNKEDLYAYKKYDNKQYSLIPGISGNKAAGSPVQELKQKTMAPGPNGEIMSPPTVKKDKLSRDANYQRDVERFKQYGFAHMG